MISKQGQRQPHFHLIVLSGNPHWCCFSSNRTLLPSSQSLLSRAAYAFRVAWSERVISDTSLKCIDQRGLRRRRTWTRQDLVYISDCFKSDRIVVEYCPVRYGPLTSSESDTSKQGTKKCRGKEKDLCII